MNGNKDIAIEILQNQIHRGKKGLGEKSKYQ